MVSGLQPSSSLGRFGLAGLPGGGAGAGVLSAQRDVSGSLSVTTREGDTFTLSASWDASVTYAGVRSQDGSGALVANAETSGSLSVAVQGDLNPGELRDIARVVRQFMHDLRDLARGQDASIADVGSGHPSTLESVSANASSQTQVTLAAADIGSAAPARLRRGHQHHGEHDRRAEFHTPEGPDFDEDDGPSAPGRGFRIGRGARIAPAPVSPPPVFEGSAAPLA